MVALTGMVWCGVFWRVSGVAIGQVIMGRVSVVGISTWVDGDTGTGVMQVAAGR